MYKLCIAKTYVYNHPSSQTDGDKSAGSQGNYHSLTINTYKETFSPSLLYA